MIQNLKTQIEGHTNPELLEKIFSDFDVEGKIKKN